MAVMSVLHSKSEQTRIHYSGMRTAPTLPYRSGSLSGRGVSVLGGVSLQGSLSGGSLSGRPSPLLPQTLFVGGKKRKLERSIVHVKVPFILLTGSLLGKFSECTERNVLS